MLDSTSFSFNLLPPCAPPVAPVDKLTMPVGANSFSSGSTRTPPVADPDAPVMPVEPVVPLIPEALPVTPVALPVIPVAPLGPDIYIFAICSGDNVDV